MGGGQLQLIAYGEQDIYLTGNPQITFFKSVYRRYTNFSMECIEQTMQGNISTNEFIGNFQIGRHGDLLHKMHFEIDLPAQTTSGISNPTNYCSYTNSTGHCYLKQMDLEIGGELIDRHYGHWYDIYNELYDNEDREHILINKHNKESFLENFWKGLTAKTKVIFISQITSSTGLILPVKEICIKAKELGLLCIIDGAHVPGHIPLDINELNHDIYTGACHKWMMTPKACSFLYVTARERIDLLIDSGSQFFEYHQFNGTRDFSAYLTIPKALEFMEENDWDNVSANCKKLTQDNVARFAELLGTYPLATVNNDFMGQLCSLPIYTNEPEKLYRLLYDRYKIEIPVIAHENKVFIRYSIQAFNEDRDLDILFDSLSDIISTTSLIKAKSSHSSNML